MSQIIITDPESFPKIVGRGRGVPCAMNDVEFLWTTMQAPELKLALMRAGPLCEMFKRWDFSGEIEILPPGAYEPGAGDMIIIYKGSTQYTLFMVR